MSIPFKGAITIGIEGSTLDRAPYSRPEAPGGTPGVLPTMKRE